MHEDEYLGQEISELIGDRDQSFQDAEEKRNTPGSFSSITGSANAPSALDNKNTNQPQSLREAVRIDKAKKEAIEKKALSVEKINPIRMQMSSLLRSAWLNLIPSWGLTLLWIDAHVFLRQILGKSMFCKLGEEWFDRPGVKKPPPKLGGEEKESKMITMSEPMGVACCNFGCLLAILLVLTIISMLAGIVDFLIDMVAGWFKGLFSWW